MNIFTKIFTRTFQGVLYVAMNFLNFREPEIIPTEEGLISLPKFIKNKGKNTILVVTDESIFKLGLVNPLIEQAQKDNIPLFV